MPQIIGTGVSYEDEDDPQMTAQIDQRSLSDPSGQMPTKVPMTFVIINGQRVAIPAGDEEGDELDQTIPPKPELKPPPPTERPPIITNPMSVLGSTGSATGKALGSLLDRPGELWPALKAFGEEIPRAAQQPSVSGLTSPSQELRQRGVDVGFAPSLMMDVALDPQNLVGGEPITDIGKVGVAAAMALPEGAQLLKGLASRLVTNVLPLIPEKGWAADRILSKIASGIASKEELATTGIGEWLKSLGSRVVTKGQFDQEIKQHGLPLYERWYGTDREADTLKNTVASANEEAENLRYRMGRGIAQDLSIASENGRNALSPDDIRAIILRGQPGLSTPENSELLTGYVGMGTKYLAARERVTSTRAALEARDAANLAEPLWGNQYSLPGGENWRELTLGLSPDAPLDIRNVTPGGSHIANDYYDRSATDSWKTRPYNITSVHKYQDPNILAHVRMGDYMTDDGRKVLVINEGQSDAHSAARDAHEALVDNILRKKSKSDEEITAIGGLTQKEQLAREFTTDPAEIAALDKQGYGTAPAGFSHNLIQGDVVPDLPFKGAGWQNLFMKRIVAYAAEHGYDEVAWTTGLQQSERYNKALRDISKITMTPEGMVQVYRGNQSYPIQTFGPYTHPSQAAHDIGAETARRLAAIPQKDNIWKYRIEDAEGKLSWREFPTEKEAEAQRLIDQETYHPADRPPEPASWWNLGWENQERVEKYWREHLQQTVLDEQKANAQASVDRKIAYDAEARAVARTRRSTTAAINRLNLPDSYYDTPNLDWQTSREVPEVDIYQPRQPTFGERAGATQREVRGYAPRGDTAPTYTVRDAIMGTAQAAGINLDPDSLRLMAQTYENVIRGENYRHGYSGGRVVALIDGSVLRTAEGRPLSIHERYLVEDAAKNAFDGVNRYKEEVEMAIKKKYNAKVKEYMQGYIDEAKNSPDYQEQLDSTLGSRLNNVWYGKGEDDRLAIAREIGIEKAFDPPHKELRPNTGDVGDVQPPDVSRELDLSENPLTISSKGMVQQYDKSMVDIASALGKKYGVRPRHLEIQTAGKAGYGYSRPVKGPLRVVAGVEGDGVRQPQYHYFDVLGADDVQIERQYANDASPEAIADAEKRANSMVQRMKDDRTVWALPMTPEMREGVKKTPFPLMSALPPAVGTYLWLKNGQRVRVTQSHDDGSFDAEPAAPQTKGARP